MANEIVENALFTSEYDNSKFRQGIAEMISDMKGAVVAQKEAQQQFSKTAEEVAKIEGELKTLAASYEGLDRSSKDYAATAGSIQKEIVKLTGQHAALSQALEKEAAQLDQVKLKYGQNAEAVNNFNKAQQTLKDGLTRTEAARKAFLDGLNETEANLNAKWGASVDKAVKDTNRLKASVEAFGGGVGKYTPSSFFDEFSKKGKKALDDVEPVVNKAKRNFTDLARVIQDLPYGMQGIQNNLTQLIPGTNGLGLAFSALISAITFAQVGLTYWVRTTHGASDEAKKLKDSVDILNKAFEDSSYSEAVVNVMELTENIQLAKEGFLDKTKVLHQYNDTIGKTTGEVKTLDEAEKALTKNGDAYIKMTLYKAAANLALQESAKKLYDAEQKRLKDELEFANSLDQFTSGTAGTGGGAGSMYGITNFNESAYSNSLREAGAKRKAKEVKASEDASKTQEDIAKTFQRKAAEIAKQFNFDFFGGTEDDKTKKDKKAPENVYEQRLKDLQARLAALNETVFSSEDTIWKKVAAQFDKDSAEIDKLFKEKKLTADQSAELKRILGIISDVQLEKELNEFRKKRIAAQKEINDELEKVRMEEVEKRLSNIQDEFERERNLIAFELEKGTREIERRREDFAAKALVKKDLGTITPEEYKAALDEINRTADKLLEDLQDYISNKGSQLGFKFLKFSLDQLNDALRISTNQISENGRFAVQNAAEMYVKGKLNYAEFQKELTRINKLENEARFQETRLTLEKEIALVEQRLLGERNEANRKALELQLSELKKQLAANNADLAVQDADNLTKDERRRLEHLNKILSMYSDFTSIVGGFLEQLSNQEQQRLDRSIAIQERRVDYAKEIANKGNAEYLELEQKRLDELHRKREEAARKQIAIDNALRLSQATVAAVSAIASAAATGDPFAAVAAGIAVLGAIAAAYAFVSGLKAPEAEFFEGSPFVEGEPGRDKIRARVTRGEAIIPVETNRKYKNAVEAIYYEEIPPEIINKFVANYPQPYFPALDYSRLAVATDGHLIKGNDKEITSRLDRLNQTLEGVVDNISNLNNFSLKLDENGFALSIVGAIKSENLKWFT